MKQKPYSIHFVCRGNTYRSRLATAYTASIVPKQFHISSSGIETHRAPVKTAETYTQAVARQASISFEIGKIKTQTNNELLSQADVIVFMNKDIYDEALRAYEFDARKAVVWHTPDMDDRVKKRAVEQHDIDALNEIAKNTFINIQKHCNELVSYVTQTSWVDIVDDRNQMGDMRLPINWVTDRDSGTAAYML